MLWLQLLVLSLETITVTLSFKHAELPDTVQSKQSAPTIEPDWTLTNRHRMVPMTIKDYGA